MTVHVLLATFESAINLGGEMKVKLRTVERQILNTSVFLVDRKKILISCPISDSFSRYETTPGMIALRGEMWMGAVGLEGDFGLLIPPADRDVDVIGYSIKEGEWDWWRFLSCITVPKGDYEVAMLFSFSNETFFDMSQDVACRLEPERLNEERGFISTDYSPDTSSVDEAWGALWRVFQRELDARIADDEYQSLTVSWLRP